MNKIAKREEAAKHATHEGVLPINGFDLSVAVLDDGTRIITQSAVFKAFGRTKRGRAKHDLRVHNRPAFMDARNLQPFVNERLEAVLNVIEFADKNGKPSKGYDAIILPELCQLYLDARQAKALTSQQIPLARASETLLLALSKVGIMALVDEATGYQDVRAKDALKHFLETFLLEEKTKWVRTFPDEFFDMIFRMKGISWMQANKGKKPQWVGHHINDFVYSRLGPEVLYSLRKLNPKNEKGNRPAKHFQYTSPEFGRIKLKEHLNILVAFGKASGYNWNTFRRLVERALPRYSQDGSQILELPFQNEKYEQIL